MPEIQLSDSSLIRVATTDNFYQSAAFIPMSFALVTTVHENGETGIGPHALVYPFGITKPHSMMLISRGSSATAANIIRTGQCALNYLEFDRESLKAVSDLGVPGRSLAQKSKDSPFTLARSPSPEQAADANCPDIIKEAFQVIECTWSRETDIDSLIQSVGDEQARHFVLNIDHILLEAKFSEGVQDGDVFPNMPIFYGFRARREFWFAEHHEPFAVPLPEVAGMEAQSLYYLANRLDENVRFTREACGKLTGIPQPFMKTALKKIIAAAIELDVTQIDIDVLEVINKKRNST
jgi:flavin reductase (DIM6/NTAB) family NADH-FMN oxidoreductase RutF